MPVASPLGSFERYLTIWVGLSISAGVAIGSLFPAFFQAVAQVEYAGVNLLVAVLIWVMIFFINFLSFFIPPPIIQPALKTR